MLLLIVAAVIFMSVPNEPVPDILDFTFMDQEGNTYRSTELQNYASAHDAPEKQPMLLLVETPDMINPDFIRQYDEMRKLALTDANIVTVVSCPVMENSPGFYTDTYTAATLRNNSKSFRVMLLDADGKVRKHWFKSAKSETLEKLFADAVKSNTAIIKKGRGTENIFAASKDPALNPNAVH